MPVLIKNDTILNATLSKFDECSKNRIPSLADQTNHGGYGDELNGMESVHSNIKSELSSSMIDLNSQLEDISSIGIGSYFPQLSSKWDGLHSRDGEQFDRFGFLINAESKDRELKENLFLYRNLRPVTGRIFPLREDFFQLVLRRELNRLKKWKNMIYLISDKETLFAGDLTAIRNVQTSKLKRLKKFSERVFKGIPQPFRCIIWPALLLNAVSISTNESITRISEMMDEGSRRVYSSLVNASTEYVRQIQLDVQRTMPHHIMFRRPNTIGPEKLQRMLQAFSSYDLDVGYCQGMANIAALFLIYLNDEYICFWMFVELFSRFRLGELYQPGFPLMPGASATHSRLLAIHAPKLFKHLKSIEVTNSMYLVKWMLSAFTCFPFHTACRLWDVILVYGIDIFPYIAVGLVISLDEELLNADFEKAVRLLTTTETLAIDDDRLLQIIRQLSKRVWKHQP